MTDTIKPKLEERSEQAYVYIPINATLKEWDKVNNLVPEVYGWLGQKGIAPAGPLLYRYWKVGDNETPFDLEVGVPIAQAVEVDGKIKLGKLNPGKYLTYQFTGHPDQLFQLHQELQHWAKEHEVKFKYQGQDDVWACRYESYFTNPTEEPDPNKWVNEIAYQVHDDTIC